MIVAERLHILIHTSNYFESLEIMGKTRSDRNELYGALFSARSALLSLVVYVPGTSLFMLPGSPDVVLVMKYDSSRCGSLHYGPAVSEHLILASLSRKPRTSLSKGYYIPGRI